MNIEENAVHGAEEEPFRIKQVEFEKSAARRSHFPKEPQLPQVAFTGRSNVGKSSLLNSLANRRQLAHVSSTPGRTQLVNFFVVNGGLRMVDLPGYGFAKAPISVKEKWGAMINGYLQENPNLRIVFTLFDVRRDLNDEDRQLLTWLGYYGITAVAVITKSDKLTRSELMRRVKDLSAVLRSYGVEDVITYSIKQPEPGRSTLMQYLGTALKSG